MKSKILKITGFVIAAAVLAFSFLYTENPKGENASAPVLTLKAEREAEEPKEKKEKKEKKEALKKQEKETEIFTQEISQENSLKENKADTLKEEASDEEKAVLEEGTVALCTISVDCKNIYDSIEDFPEEKHALLPPDGYILPPSELEFDEGESVFDVLKRELVKRKIHFEFSTAAYNSAYIEGINNIYEFDCGELSGWIYSVNGIVPQYSCSDYKLKKGDIVKFTYTCTLEQSTQIN